MPSPWAICINSPRRGHTCSADCRNRRHQRSSELDRSRRFTDDPESRRFLRGNRRQSRTQVGRCRAGARSLQAPPLLARAAKRALIRDVTLVWPSLARRRSIVNAQTFVVGREATSAVACWNGQILASLHFEVVNKAGSSGHATVLRLIDNQEMAAAAEKMARRLNLSGMHGFDFMLEAQTGNAYLIEINARSTQVGHLTLGLGRESGAVFSARPDRKFTQQQASHRTTRCAISAGVDSRPSQSVFEICLSRCPLGRPELIRACVSARRKQHAWYSQPSQLQGFSMARAPRV